MKQHRARLPEELTPVSVLRLFERIVKRLEGGGMECMIVADSIAREVENERRRIKRGRKLQSKIDHDLAAIAEER